MSDSNKIKLVKSTPNFSLSNLYGSSTLTYATQSSSKVFNTDRNCSSIKANYIISNKHIINIKFTNKLVKDYVISFNININNFSDNKRRILDNISNNKSFNIKLLDEYYGFGCTYIIFCGYIISIAIDDEFSEEYLIKITYWDLIEIFEKIENID